MRSLSSLVCLGYNYRATRRIVDTQSEIIVAASLSLYRKYRSQTFDELVGQEPVVKTLKNAIATGRIGHAYLFTGPRGVGKTSAARLLARAANCLSEGPDKPCNECANCLAAGREIATDLIEIDAASNTGVDNIREVIERAQFAPSVWHTKFYIIDEVHMLSVSAFNALLKTLEEPPPHVGFILATTEVHKVPATVASRCQRFDFRRVPMQSMVARLRWVCDQEGIEADDGALELVARQATGSLRDALSLMDQLRVFSEGGITLNEVQDMLGASGSEKVADFVDCLIGADLASGLRMINSVAEDGLDIRQFNRQIVEHLRSLMMVKSGAASSEGTLIDVTEEMRKRLTAQSGKTTIPDLLRWIKAFAEADSNLRTTSYRQLPLEMALVSATLPEQAPVRDHSGDITAAIETVGQVPRAGAPAPQQQPAGTSAARTREAAVRPSGPPPPIHMDLGSVMSSNGNGVTAEDHTVTKAAPEELTHDLEPVEVVAHAQEDGNGNGNDSGSATSNGHITIDEPSGVEIEPGDELEQLRLLWPRVVDQINARSKPMAAVFRDPGQVRPYSVVGRVCTISFKYKMHAERSRGDQQRNLIEQSISRVLGRPCVVETITFDEEGKDPGNGGEPASPRKPKDKPPAPHETPRGRAAMNIFGFDKFDEE